MRPGGGPVVTGKSLDSVSRNGYERSIRGYLDDDIIAVVDDVNVAGGIDRGALDLSERRVKRLLHTGWKYPRRSGDGGYYLSDLRLRRAGRE